MVSEFPADKYFCKMRAGAVPQFDFSQAETPAEIGAMQEAGRKKLLRLLNIGGIPGKLQKTLVSCLESPVDMGFYTRERLLLTVCTDLQFPMYVLRPKDKGKKNPVAVTCCGHGYGVKESLGLDEAGEVELEDPGYQKRFPVELCRLGYTVAAPEVLNFGDTAFSPEFRGEASSCYLASVNLIMRGLNICGLRVFQMRRVMDYLLQEEHGNPDTLLMMGISGGGMLTAFTAAADTRVKAAVVSGYLSSFRASVLSIEHYLCNFVPDLCRYFEMKDIASLIAPRPLFLEAGEFDPIFPIQAVRDCYGHLDRIYGLLGAKDGLGIDIFPDGHRISGKICYDFLKEKVLTK